MANHNTKNLRRGPWLEEEDERLTTIIGALGERHWDALAKQSGLRRSGKSCRLRWMNYLRPNLKHGEITNEEEHIILNLQKQWGNKWSRIAKRLPGRTDNEIKNYWRSHLKKKIEAQQEFFGGVLNDKKQDFMTSKCNENPNQESCMNKKDGVFGNSSLEAFDMNAFMNDLPYENRMTDGISCSWPCEENEQTDEAKYHEDCMGTYPCFCQLGSSSEESETHCVWDLWSPI